MKALKKIAEENNYKAQLIGSVEDVNNRQKFVIANKVIKKFGEDLTGKVFALWGLAFKPSTDDVRESPAIYVVKELVKRGAKVQAYDPKAIEEAKHFYLKNVEYCERKYEVLRDSDALILLTEWKEFRSPDFEEIKRELNSPVISDGRNQYIAYGLEDRDFEYYRIGK